MLGVEERRLRRMSYTPQGGATEDNAADDILMVNQGSFNDLRNYNDGNLHEIYRQIAISFFVCHGLIFVSCNLSNSLSYFSIMLSQAKAPIKSDNCSVNF
jgi:hypothetical protein